ncbi:E3 ubiquitin-protein ligase ZNRF3-like [Carica papaya]|uniref:E3 ubiquitin-protein ligase ZNRF3-like n=1 Tax=Carica papaya TaxID=3649 RepID=UPI000B8CC95B|nr:E3 ubiquitin-protein ligase ZNRF3-like [Carica papaya]
MAGMLPGVECARRRRFHQSVACSDSSPSLAAHGWTRRPSFCLYSSNRETHHSSVSSLPRLKSNQAYSQDEKLGEIAREAKERLDERLRTQRKLDPKRKKNIDEKLKVADGRSTAAVRELQTEVFGLKKTGTKRSTWPKLISWKAKEQEECAICLEKFKGGETLVNLSCAHRFHSRCLMPWVENHAHCPFCRTEILS